MAKRVLVLTDSIGRGDEELGRVLMKNFLYALARSETRPTAVVFMNEGVRLAVYTATGRLKESRIAAARSKNAAATWSKAPTTKRCSTTMEPFSGANGSSRSTSRWPTAG